MKFAVKLECLRLLLLLLIFVLLTYKDESQITEVNDHSDAIQQDGPITMKHVTKARKVSIPQMATVVESTEPSNIKETAKISTISGSEEAQAKKMEEGVRKVMSKSRKLMGINKNNVSNIKRHAETTLEPGSDHNGVDTAGSVAFSADYRSPRHHPPENN